MTEIKRYQPAWSESIKSIVHGILDQGTFVLYKDHDAIVAAKDARIAKLQEQVRALDEFRGKVRDSFEMGELAEDFAVFVNIQNAMRRSDCLSAIEREFFTREVPDEDYPDEMGEECDLSWGKGPVEYTENFRIAIREIRAQARAEGIHFAANRLLAAWESGFVDDTPAAVHDISGAILSAVEFLPNADEAEFKRDYADEVRARIRAGEKS